MATSTIAAANPQRNPRWGSNPAKADPAFSSNLVDPSSTPFAR